MVNPVDASIDGLGMHGQLLGTCLEDQVQLNVGKLQRAAREQFFQYNHVPLGFYLFLPIMGAGKLALYGFRPDFQAPATRARFAELARELVQRGGAYATIVLCEVLLGYRGTERRRALLCSLETRTHDNHVWYAPISSGPVVVIDLFKEEPNPEPSGRLFGFFRPGS